MDIKCDAGSVPVFALADGEVVEACDGQGEGHFDWSTAKCGQGGNFVKIKYSIKDAPLYVFYYHLTQGSVRTGKGEKKKKGEQVGLTGNTGNSYGIHLDVTAQRDEHPEYGPNYDPDSVVNFAVETELNGWDGCFISKRAHADENESF